MFTNSRRTISVSTSLITPSHILQSETDGRKSGARRYYRVDQEGLARREEGVKE